MHVLAHTLLTYFRPVGMVNLSFIKTKLKKVGMEHDRQGRACVYAKYAAARFNF